VCLCDRERVCACVLEWVKEGDLGRVCVWEREEQGESERGCKSVYVRKSVWMRVYVWEEVN